ncbi:MAG: ABC transporter ATP-binding protein [Hyphomicrobiaceae bacterium]
MSESVIEVSGLDVAFGDLKVVDNVSFSIKPGKTLGLVGESGSGKSVTSLAILQLLAAVGSGRIARGELTLNAGNRSYPLRKLGERELRSLRGGAMAMIFQDPMSSLDPIWSIGDQLVECIRQHQPMSKSAARAHAVEALRLVGIPAPEQRMKDYPHQFSGGMRQRVMIAAALANRPAFLIADEPTTALDVTIQAQILALLKTLQNDFGMAMLFISHNMAVVAEVADEVAVMYAGQIVETAPVAEIFRHPRHPYTKGLLGSIPQPGGQDSPSRLPTIGGAPPLLSDLPGGCRFAPRCTYATEACTGTPPDLQVAGESHMTRCIRFREIWP